MKILPLTGYKSLRAFNAFHTLMLGMKMLPTYMEVPYDDFLAAVEKMSEAEQRKLIREGALFVKLDKEEVDALLCFSTDKNGVPYSDENLKNLGPGDIVNVIVEVCFEISKIKVDFVTDREKKN